MDLPYADKETLYLAMRIALRDRYMNNIHYHRSSVLIPRETEAT